MDAQLAADGLADRHARDAVNKDVRPGLFLRRILARHVSGTAQLRRIRFGREHVVGGGRRQQVRQTITGHAPEDRFGGRRRPEAIGQMSGAGRGRPVAAARAAPRHGAMLASASMPPVDRFAFLKPADRGRLRRMPRPDWLEPMLATLTADRFSDPAWLYERKLDGE